MSGGALLRPGPAYIGRTRELCQLQAHLAQARDGQRQLVFVSGEAGIGKTTVIDAFLSQLTDPADIWVGRSQCIEQYGEGEAYLPILDALSQLCREVDHGLDILHRYAPTCLVHLPELVTDAERTELYQQVRNASRIRMFLEMAQAFEALAAEKPVVFIYEDLHWSDASTVAFITYLAQRRETARLLILGTYRPEDVILANHPLKTALPELMGRGQGVELALTPLNLAHVERFLSRWLGGAISSELTSFLHRHTAGNALFVVNMIEYLVRRDLLTQEGGGHGACARCSPPQPSPCRKGCAR